MRSFVPLLFLACASVASAAGQFTNSSTSANALASRATWMTNVGLLSPTYLVDFENFDVNTNLNGATNVLPGGLTIATPSSGASGTVQSAASNFGSSNPIGTKALALVNGTITLAFSIPVDYVGLRDIDTGGGTVTVTYVGGATETYSSIDATDSSGNSAEFLGIFRNDMPQITSFKLVATAGDGELGFDNIEYGVQTVPEPGSLAALGLGAAALLRRRRSR